jgi:hypothetical protein
LETDVLKYISNTKIEKIEDVDFNYLINYVFPGQTVESTTIFVKYFQNKSLNKLKQNLKKDATGKCRINMDSLHEICSQQWANPRTVPSGAHSN